MKQLLFVAILAVAAFVGVSALPHSSAAAPNPAYWPDLAPGCFDVTGDGKVDLANDILGVVLHYNATALSEDINLPPYSLLYDVSGGGIVDLSNDILGAVLAYDDDGVPDCPLIDRQVILATAATMKYQDPQVAFDDGYGYGSQYIPQMGIHLVNPDFQTTYTMFYDEGELGKAPEDQLHQLTHPVGLVYSDAGGNIPETLIGVWYITPVQAVCDFYGIPGPCYPSLTVQPVGFGETNTDEDNPDLILNPVSNGWHTHTGLCIKGWDTVNALVTGENVSQGSCLSHSDYWFSTYGWMMHMYNFVPNPEGRFRKWNTNPILPLP
jgi:hypothetical protein